MTAQNVDRIYHYSSVTKPSHAISVTVHCVSLHANLNKYAGLPYCFAEMYAGRVACCPPVSNGEYADGTERQTIRQTIRKTGIFVTDGRHTVTLRYSPA